MASECERSLNRIAAVISMAAVYFLLNFKLLKRSRRCTRQSTLLTTHCAAMLHIKCSQHGAAVNQRYVVYRCCCKNERVSEHGFSHSTLQLLDKVERLASRGNAAAQLYLGLFT